MQYIGVMAQSVTFKQYEKAIYSSLWADGLLDIFAGVALLGVGIAWLAGHLVFGGVGVGIATILYPLVRKRWVETRTGAFQPSVTRQVRESRKLLGLVIAGIGALAVNVFLLAEVPEGRLLQNLSPAIPSFILAFMGLCAGLMLTHWRFAAYGLLMIALGVMGILTGLEPSLQIGCGGATILVLGIVRSGRFLEQYPVQGA